ncbi:hypothetical protein ACTXJX_02860 [Glutamicibacter ardleyensis]|uniref:hypothetical protein n=1 Tax=Glutamicibacter ardleyensis TaxID=225894 RepID=UPI003FD17B45
MKLNSFGETIRRIEAERLAEAQKAIEAGWAEDDHPAKCCPPVIAPRRAGKTARSIEETQRLHDKATNRRKWWEDALKRREQALSDHEASVPKFDHGMMQLSLDYRRKGMARGKRLWEEADHAKERADHFQRLAKKYQDQINKRS